MITNNKHYNEPSVFTPENLLREARRQKNIDDCKIPEICVLDPDGDLVEYLIRTQQATRNECWACYHTKLYTVKQKEIEFVVLDCGVGSSFAVLIAEQLFASGCKTLISIASAGVINSTKNNSKFILIEQAIRDEGTSYHYLPANETSNINSGLSDSLMNYYRTTDLQIETGNSWTTDAPYRETRRAIEEAKKLNAVCVEMEAAALYAFAKAKNKDVICFAHLTNTMAQTEGDFEKGEEMGSLDTLDLIHHTINAVTKNQAYHWNKIYAARQPNEVSWTQEIPKTSLDFIHSFSLPKTANIIDIGGGESKLVDYLLNEGYENITVLDISKNALDKAKKRLGDKAQKVNWVVSDVTEFKPTTNYDVWHDRATFHFLTTGEQVSKYLDIARNHVNGYMTIGTFSTDGPTKCSGLDIRQYDEQTLTSELENGFKKLKCITEDHTTPFSTTQNFLFCSFKRRLH
ncbi:MAG TPA: methyltransferase domain-containing protein [Agriterribacter sp.]|nr:methyltransferase domain-containing protein [Agriterribacter sp.]